MKTSANWLKRFTDIDLSVDELVKRIGAQLGAVEEVVDLGKKYQGIVVAKVVACEKHPNADKLHVCKIDDGGKAQNVERDEKGYVQVVCGASNVREGLTVAWLPPATVVPSTFGKEPFTLEAREIRGEASNGMLASASELAISDDHSGIVELDEGEPGEDFAEKFGLNDHIIYIENKMFTHRPDCFGQMGVAREIAGIQGLKFQSPDWYLQAESTFDVDSGGDRVKRQESSELKVEVRNDIPELVPRFMAVAISGVEVKPSPFWLQTYLARVGIRPINNVVDLTNYFMMLTGQPLHAYDSDKLNRVVSRQSSVVSLEARMSREGEKLRILGGKEITFEDDETILIASGDVPVGVGGVIGGTDTEVSETTKNIVLECASFDLYSIRRTSMKYGLFTDAVTRFSKGQSPLQNDKVIAKTVDDILQTAGGKIASELIDNPSYELRTPSPETVHPPVEVDVQFINERLGVSLSAEEMKTLLENVEFKVEAPHSPLPTPHSDASLRVTAPFWRTDIEIPEDTVEEIGRLYGYDHLPMELPKRSIKPAAKDPLLELKSKIREVLSKSGANEALTYSFVHGDLLEKAGQNKEQAFKLSNASSPDLHYFRMSLTPSLLEKIHPNVKSGYDKFAIFEIGKSHIKSQQDEHEPEVPMEFNAVSLVFASAKPDEGAAFYQAKKYLKTLLDELGAEAEFEPIGEIDQNSVIAKTIAPYEPNRSVLVKIGGKTFGVVGEFKQSVTKSFKLPAYTAGFELGLFALHRGKQQQYTPLSRYPSVQQDISLKVAADQQYHPLFVELQTGLNELANAHLQSELTPLDIYAKDENKHFTFRLTAAHYQKTLKAAEINELLNRLAERVEDKFGAQRI